MSVPDFQSMLSPLLEAVSDGAEHRNGAAYEVVSRQMKVSPEDLQLMHSGGEQTVFYNRVAWAKTYLKKAGLIESPKRGTIRITEAGLDALHKRPEKINVRFLKSLAGDEWRKASVPEIEDVGADPAVEVDATPEEQIEAGFQTLKGVLQSDLLDQVKRCSPQFFERLVVRLLVAMGYGGSLEDAGQVVGKSGDGGIDGIIKEDKLGLDVLCIQAKRWEGTVGRPVVQAFAGSMEGFRARKGVLITTSSFSKDAEEYVGRIERKIVLVDGERLAELMIAHNIGVTLTRSYEIKRVDSDFFVEDE